MNNMNVFKKGWFTWRQPIKSIKLMYRRCKWAWQRITRGYADCDIWDLDDYFADLISHALWTFSDNATGWPDYRFDTFEEWKDYIREIGNYFYFIKEDAYDTPALDEWSDNLPEHWLCKKEEETEEFKELTRKMREEENHIWEQRQKYKDMALDSLREMWFMLWD